MIYVEVANSHVGLGTRTRLGEYAFKCEYDVYMRFDSHNTVNLQLGGRSSVATPTIYCVAVRVHIMSGT